MKSKTPEGHVLKSILDYLAAKRILAFRMQVGILKSGNRRIAFGTPGMADIVAYPQYLDNLMVWHPRVLWIECKAGKGKQTEMQKSFQRHVQDQNHAYIIAHSIEDVEAAL